MFLLRHGQSYFNLHFTQTRRDPGIEDPELTELGHEQAHKAAFALAKADIKRMIVSPYTRALQTATPFLSRAGVEVEIMPQVRERTAFVCDVGSAPAALAERFPHYQFGHLSEGWWGAGQESEAETIVRARAFQALMQSREDAKHTLLVSHWGFILALTGVSVANGQWIEFDPADKAPDQIIWRP